MANKQDSNQTGLRYAQEASLKVLPGTPVWKQFEPNSYGDFGGSTTKTARNPINAGRQRKKGVTTDLDASGSFNQDLTMENTADVLQGFFFADAREKPSTMPLNGSATVVITSASTGAANDYNAAAGLGVFKVGAIVLAAGFGPAANNGIKDVTAVAAAKVTVSQALTAEAAPPATAKLDTVGHTFGAAEMAIVMNGNLCRLTSSVADMTTFGLIPGEWIYVGGDAAGSKFVNNQGFARIGLAGVQAGYLEFDKTEWEPQAEAGAGISLKVYFGKVIRNEVGALIKKRSYQLERTLGNDANGEMSEYLVGATPNEFSVSIPKADKVTCDLSFVALDHEPRTGLDGVKAGDRPNLPATDAFNTSNMVSRIKMSLVSTTDSNVTPLFAYVDELSLSINNNVTLDKAVGVLGGFDTTAGNFDVDGNVTVFFADNVAVQAVRNNSDVTLDIILVEENRGLMIDIPLISLGDGRLNVEANQSIKLPLSTMAAESDFGNTALFQLFPYLPTAAA
jgi:hypothetical protein